MEYQDRVNRPLGMSDVDLLIYDKDIYTMFRTHEGLEPDAFRYDPIVSAGMLASDYAFAQGMQWVNLLTPDSQDKINPGDDLVVPVRTYDYYGQNPPIEKVLTHEVSYTANQLNYVRAMSLGNNFVGDFNNYFDQESSLLGSALYGTATVSPNLSALTSPTLSTAVTATPTAIAMPKPTATPTTFTASPTPTTFTASPTPTPTTTYTRPPVTYETAAPRAAIINPNIRPVPMATEFVRPRVTYATYAGGPGGLVALGNSGTGTGTSTGTSTGTGTGTSTGTGATSGGGVIDGGAFPMGGGGGGIAMGGGGAEAPASSETAPGETAPTETKKDTASSAKTEAKMDYKFIIIGIIVLGVIGYYYAKSYNKDIKTFTVSGAIVGGILGYIYNQHQTKPIDVLSKIGIKSKSESGYFIDDI